MIIVKVKKIIYNSSNHKYSIILENQNNTKYLSILVTYKDAQDISSALKNNIDKSPNIYDLICKIIDRFNGHISKIKINKNIQDVYETKMIFIFNNKKIPLVLRLSDAIIIALKMKVDILVEEELLINSKIKNESKSDRNSTFVLKMLNTKLKKAIKNEAYEIAAKLRDQILTLKI